MFKVNEIKSWAKKGEITLKKQGDGYVWYHKGATPSEPTAIEEAVKGIFNHMTGDKYIEHQKAYRPSGNT